MPLIALTALLALASPSDKIAGTFRYDPVLLVRTQKREIGAYSLFVDHEAYRYLFSSESTRQEFLQHPDRYEIQLGGGCGKMGSLSGRGSPDRFAVYEGKIYIFASDGCRETFLKDAERHIERDDPRPAGTAAERASGARWVDRALEWAGGKKALGQLKVLQVQVSERPKFGEKVYDHVNVFAVQFPEGVYQKDFWDGSGYIDVSDGRAGIMGVGRSDMPMGRAQVRAMARLRNHLPITVLKSAARRDFVAFDRGELPGGRRRIDTHFDGTWVALEIAADSGEIKAIEFVGRRMPHARERHEYASFRDVAGVKVPDAWSVTFDQKLEKRIEARQVSYRTDAEGISFSVR